MSEAEVILYIALSSVLFMWGTVLLIRNLICRGKSKRLVGVVKLVVWFFVPPILGLFAMAAMMDPHGGDPVISTLRSISVIYIVGSAVFIITEHEKKNEQAPS